MHYSETQDEQLLRQEQLDLEKEHDTQAVTDILKERRNILDDGEVTRHPQVHSIIRSALPRVRDVLDEYRSTRGIGKYGKYRRILREIDLDVLAASTIIAVFSHYFSTIAQNKPIIFQGLARFVGMATVVELIVSQTTKVNPLFMAEVHRKIRDVNTTDHRHIRSVYRNAYRKVMPDGTRMEMSTSDYIHIGKFGVDACYEAGILISERKYGRGGTMITYHLNPEIEDYLYSAGGRTVLNRIVSTTYHRMICKPDRWDSPIGGGYLSLRRKAQCGLIVHRHRSRESMDEYYDTLRKVNMAKVYRCANYLQEVPYTIHKPTQNLIQQVWESGGGIFGIPARKMRDKPEFPFDGKTWDKDEATPEEQLQHRVWKRKAREWYEDSNRNKTKQREVWGFLRHLDTGHDKIYFPVFMDRRGRWYYRANPNPQGSDVARATLHFYNKKPLGDTGLYWLKVHVANLLGVDDIRFDKRVQYVDSILPDLFKAVDNPIDNHNVFGDESPINAYSAVYELKQAVESGSPETYETGIPVHMDATVSGTQHYSALLRDPMGAKYSNLVDSGGDKKADLYTAVANAAMQFIQQDINEGKNLEHAELWSEIGTPRDMVKRPVMVYNYNVTLFSVCNYIQDWIDEHMPEQSIRLNNAALRYLGKKLFKGLEETIPATAQGMRYLSEVGREVGSTAPMHWVTPGSGMLVYHEYNKTKDRRITVNSAGIRITTVRELLPDVRPSGMRAALAPNFIHSLDAAHLTLVALEMNKLGADFVGIHDSFGTHPGDVEAMHKIIRQQFYELHSQDILEEFRQQVGSEIPIPERGDLDLSEVLNSEFMFC